MSRWFCSFTVVLMICVNADAAKIRLEIFEGPEVTIQYEKPLRNIVPDVAKVYPRAKETLERKLGLESDLKPVIVLIHTDSEFISMTGGNELVNAFAVSNSNYIYINYSRMLKTPFDLELTLLHELCHLLLHEYIHPHDLPKWLNEGVSQWVSGGIADIITYNGKKLLKQAVLSGNYLTLESLSRRFPAESNQFILAYEESKSVVEYIVGKYSAEKLLLILEKLHKGDMIDTAVRDVLGTDLMGLEHDWHEHLRKKHTLYAYISDNFYWILFVLAAILTVIGYLRLRIRMKTHFEDEDEEDYQEL